MHDCTFNMFADAPLDAKVGIPTLKSRSINKNDRTKLTKSNVDLCDIWRIRNPKNLKYTF